MKVEWAEAAVQEMRLIRTSTYWKSAGYGQAIVDRIFHRARKLDTFLEFGSEVPEYGDPDIREVYEHPYRIIFRMVQGIVLIVTVLHSSRQMPNTLPEA